MFKLHAEKNNLRVRQREVLTSGSVNVYKVSFTFSSDWDGLSKTVSFKHGSIIRTILLDESKNCQIPWEVLESPSGEVYVGICGTKGSELVLPTVWESLGIILEGTAINDAHPPSPPTPNIYAQILEELERTKGALQENYYDKDAVDRMIEGLAGFKMNFELKTIVIHSGETSVSERLEDGQKLVAACAREEDGDAVLINISITGNTLTAKIAEAYSKDIIVNVMLM